MLRGKQKPGAGCAELRKNFVVVSGGHPGGLNLLWVSMEGGVGRVKGFRQGQPPLSSGAAKRDQLERGGGGKDGITLVYPFLLKD